MVNDLLFRGSRIIYRWTPVHKKYSKFHNYFID